MYYLGAQAAFLIGTLSDKIFAPFWPPNVVLFCALLLAAPSRWWLYVLAVFPAHAIAEIGVGMPAGQLFVAFATNCSVALVSAVAVRSILGGPPWFSNVRRACAFIAMTAFASPGVSALGGAFVPILGGGSLGDYWAFWWHWHLANTLTNLTLSPMFVILYGEDTNWLRTAPLGRQVEGAALAVLLAVVCAVTLTFSGGAIHAGLIPALLYAPLPLVLWATIRFGAVGASSAVLIVTVVLISHSLKGPSPFVGVNPQQNVLSLQLFLTALSAPVLLLGALIDQLRLAREKMQTLAHSVLRERDNERRRIARELHESTGQNLVGAMMAVNQLEKDIPESAKATQKIEGLLQKSISDLRSVSYVLHPPLLDEGGLPLALRNYISDYGGEVDLVVSTELCRLPADVEIALFRVVQDGLALIEHQSAGRAARVRLRQEAVKDGEVVVLTIDDLEEGHSGNSLSAAVGRHFKPELTKGVWVVGMTERIQQIGGRIEIVSGAGATIVSATIRVR